MMVTEGELLRDVPPFSQVREWLDKVESRKHDRAWRMIMIMKVSRSWTLRL